MSDKIKHECGLAFIRLLKPLSFYKDKYGTSRYGLLKMNQLMQKLINRGQDGAGIATVKLDMPYVFQHIDRLRSAQHKAVDDIFSQINQTYQTAKNEQPERYNNINWQKNNLPFMGEVLLGHLRYGTFGENNFENCHPFNRPGKSSSCDLVLAGNFNLTNVSDLKDFLANAGCNYNNQTDTITLMETIGYFLDKQTQSLTEQFKQKELSSEEEINEAVRTNIDIIEILKGSSKNWDGGYVMGGMIGNGDAFVMRDPNGIRPAYFYKDDEIIVIASERPVIQTVFNKEYDSIQELSPGHAAIIKSNGDFSQQQINLSATIKPCSFERIYFSRGNDADIYKERRALGANLVNKVLTAVNYDLENTVFSYIPNTAEAAFEGLMDGINSELDVLKVNQIKKLGTTENTGLIQQIISKRPRIRKVIIKDVKQRTFITDDSNRNEMVNQVYDITYKTVNNTDMLVVVDDSIVRGTTLKHSILNILDRLNPKKIIIVSSAPQIRYPDCYGIDMSVLNSFIAFEAAIELVKEKKGVNFLTNKYEKVLGEIKKPSADQKNILQEIYDELTYDDVTLKITKMLKPENLRANFEIIYQSPEGLTKSCPNNSGDWYFTGNYPTCGGNRVVNQALINYFENNGNRAY